MSATCKPFLCSSTFLLKMHFLICFSPSFLQVTSSQNQGCFGPQLSGQVNHFRDCLSRNSNIWRQLDRAHFIGKFASSGGVSSSNSGDISLALSAAILLAVSLCCLLCSACCCSICFSLLTSSCSNRSNKTPS